MRHALASLAAISLAPLAIAAPGDPATTLWFEQPATRFQQSLPLGGVTEEVLVEHCDIRDTDVGIAIKPCARGVLLRDNRFENVAQPEVRPTPAR